LLEPLRNIGFRGATGKREDVFIREPGQENTEGMPRTCFQFNNVDGALVADLFTGDFYHHPIMLHGRFGCRAVRMRNLRLFDTGQQFVKGTSGGSGRISAKDCASSNASSNTPTSAPWRIRATQKAWTSTVTTATSCATASFGTCM
jgi:hypothetical protein